MPLLLLAFLIFFAAPLQAESDSGETSTTVPINSESQIELLPQASIVPPGTLTLRNGRYTVPFAEALNGMPAFSLGVSSALFSSGYFQVFAQAAAGYRYKAGSFPVELPNGQKIRENLSLHWVPLSLSTRVEYTIPQLSVVRPTLTIGGGTQWMRRIGNLPGLTQSFWVPYGFVSPSLMLFSRTDRDWFGGFSFGPTFYQSFLSLQDVSGISLDMTLHLFL